MSGRVTPLSRYFLAVRKAQRYAKKARALRAEGEHVRADRAHALALTWLERATGEQPSPVKAPRAKEER